MLETKSFTLTVTAENKTRKIAKIEFGPKGDIYIFFSKFKPSTGVVSLCTYKANLTKTDLNLATPGQGKVTSHIVKYSHHFDGRAHFSQDGKVYTKIIKQSAPLSDQQVHLFTIQIQGFNSFPEHKINPRVPNFNVDTVSSHGLKIIGRWFLKSSFTTQSTPIPNAPMILRSPRGEQIGQGYYPPKENPLRDFFLYLSPRLIWPMDEKSIPTLSFIGGFDPSDIAFDKSKDTSFLALLYPCSDINELTKKIGSIDFIKE